MALKTMSDILIGIVLLSFQSTTQLLSLLHHVLAAGTARLDRVAVTAAGITARSAVMPRCRSSATAGREVAADERRRVITRGRLRGTAVHAGHT